MDQQTKNLLELSRQHQAAMEYSRRALTELEHTYSMADVLAEAIEGEVAAYSTLYEAFYA